MNSNTKEARKELPVKDREWLSGVVKLARSGAPPLQCQTPAKIECLDDFRDVVTLTMAGGSVATA